MANAYFLWEKSELYTNFGMAETWFMHKNFEHRREFDRGLVLPGILDGKSYQDIPIDMSVMAVPSSRVVYVITRQSEAQAPRPALYNPMHKFCKTDGTIVFAKDLKYNDILVALFAESRVVDVKQMDYQSSKWITLTTNSASPNIFVNNLLTFPTTLAEVQKYEDIRSGEVLAEMEFEGAPEIEVEPVKREEIPVKRRGRRKKTEEVVAV